MPRLSQLGPILQSPDAPIEERLQESATLVAALAGADACLVLRRGEADSLRVAAAGDWAGESLVGIRVPGGPGTLAHHCLHAVGPVWVMDVAAETRFQISSTSYFFVDILLKEH